MIIHIYLTVETRPSVKAVNDCKGLNENDDDRSIKLTLPDQTWHIALTKLRRFTVIHSLFYVVFMCVFLRLYL